MNAKMDTSKYINMNNFFLFRNMIFFKSMNYYNNNNNYCFMKILTLSKYIII